tara:strand:- start:129 stop:683 length:555 start_codon:yes stop_codon:yes gene_type:complete
MWARIEDGEIVQTISSPKSIVVNHVHHPKAIFGSSWTNEERKAIGIVPYEYPGSHGDSRFYNNSESSPVVGSDKVVITKSKSARSVSDVKKDLKKEVNRILKGCLDRTDWVVVRKAETGKDAPADIAKWRTDLREKAAALETSIDSKSDIAGLEAIAAFTQEMADAGKTASEFDDWPKDPRSSS